MHVQLSYCPRKTVPRSRCSLMHRLLTVIRSTHVVSCELLFPSRVCHFPPTLWPINWLTSHQPSQYRYHERVVFSRCPPVLFGIPYILLLVLPPSSMREHTIHIRVPSNNLLQWPSPRCLWYTSQTQWDSFPNSGVIVSVCSHVQPDDRVTYMKRFSGHLLLAFLSMTEIFWYEWLYRRRSQAERGWVGNGSL